jgi:hypothetical protein
MIYDRNIVLHMNDLVRKYTNFESWEEMKIEMEKHNFVPVIVNKEFRDSLVKLGYKVTEGVIDRSQEL